MYHPTGFKDGTKFVIINGEPQYYDKSNTYMGKLIDGLLLEYVFQQNPIHYEQKKLQVIDDLQETDKSTTTILQREIFEYVVNADDFNINKSIRISKRKSKYPKLKRNNTNMKKNKVKYNGSTDKMNQIDMFDETEFIGYNPNSYFEESYHLEEIPYYEAEDYNDGDDHSYDEHSYDRSYGDEHSYDESYDPDYGW
jgi:hypothetical protein